MTHCETVPEEDSVALLLKKLSCISPEQIEKDAALKKTALHTAKSLVTQLSDPVNAAYDLVYSPFFPMAARIAVDLDLFSIIASNDRPMSVKELADSTGADELLVARLLRTLASIDFVRKAGEDQYGATIITKTMAKPVLQSGYRVAWDIYINSAAKIPQYFRETGYHLGSEPRDGLIQYAHQTKLDFFSFLNNMPQLVKDFNMYMGSAMGNRKYWTDWYPVQERVIDGFDPNTTLLVDVGGGKGHDLDAFHNKYPGKGRLVLQDLPQVIEDLKKSEKVYECTVHSFFDEQPIKGARVYLLHHILHDWADDKALEILKCLKDAMSPGYSKLIIHELILSDSVASAYQSRYDMLMMTLNWGMERSRTQWQALLGKAGLHIVKFMAPDMDSDGVVEVMLE